MEKRLLVFIVTILMTVSAIPMNLVFARTADDCENGTLGDVASYAYYENHCVAIEAKASINESIFVMAVSYDDGKMLAFDMVELSADEEGTLMLQSWGEEVKLFAVSKEYIPLCKAVNMGEIAEAPLDASEVEVLIRKAEELLDETFRISADGSDVPADELWVTAKMKEDLQDAMYTAAEWFYNDEFENQEQIDFVVDELENAIASFKPAYGSATMDLSELEDKINEAGNLLNGDYQVSVNGSDVAQDKQWVTAKMKADLEDALYGALDGLNNKDFENQEQIDTAVATLEQAIKAFKPAYGMSVFDTVELEALISEAGELLDVGYKISVDGSDITKDKMWVTAKMKADLEDEMYTAAEWFYNDEFESQEQVDATVEALRNAIEAFRPAYGTL